MILHSDITPVSPAFRDFRRVGTTKPVLTLDEALIVIGVAGTTVEPATPETAYAIAEALWNRGLKNRANMFGRFGDQLASELKPSAPDVAEKAWGRQPAPIAPPLTAEELGRVEQQLKEQAEEAAKAGDPKKTLEDIRRELASKFEAVSITEEGGALIAVTSQGIIRSEDSGATWTELVDPNAKTDPAPAPEQNPAESEQIPADGSAAAPGNQPPADLEVEKPAPTLTVEQLANVDAAQELSAKVKAATTKAELGAIAARVGLDVHPKWNVETIKHKLAEQIAKNVADDKPPQAP